MRGAAVEPQDKWQRSCLDEAIKAEADESGDTISERLFVPLSLLLTAPARPSPRGEAD